MPTSKTSIPFYDDDFVYFELHSPKLVAFDIHHDGATYSVPNFQPGAFCLPIDAICPATAEDVIERPDQIIHVDVCQIFLVDADHYSKFRESLDFDQACWPNYAYFEKLRTQVGVDFGHANVTSDGMYVLNVSTMMRIVPGRDRKSIPRPTEDPYEKVARRMRTFVCEKCYREELMENRQTYQELAQEAKDKGWLLMPPDGKRESWFFEAFQVVGPQCAAKLGTTG